MSDIYMDIEKYRSTVAALRRISANLGDNRANMTYLMGFVGDVWQGAASDAFLEANEWTVKDIERLRFDIEDLATNIETTIAILEEALLSMKGML